MISATFQDTLSEQWVKAHLPNGHHELVILRKIIPWQWLMLQLIPFYSPDKGKFGTSLRIITAVLILQFLRGFSDRKVIESIQENRYMQYFCNVSDKDLFTFMDSSTLVRFRKRLGVKGIALIEEGIFRTLKEAGIIKGENCLMDSTVLEANIAYPTDVHLLWKAIKKIQDASHHHNVSCWWDTQAVKKRWRVFGRDKKTPMLEYLKEFFEYFSQVLAGFEIIGVDWTEYDRLFPLFLC